MATGGAIIGFAQAQLGFDRTDIGIAGLEEAQLLEVCNQAVIEYYEAHRKGGGEPPIQFQKEFGDDLTADTVTTEVVTSATTDFDVSDSSNFPTSGVLALWDNEEPDYTFFTGNAANNFTGVTEIGYDHRSGVTCSRLYPLPSDFNDLRSDEFSPFGVRVEGFPYSHTSSAPRGANFHLFSDGTTKFLHFPQGLVGGMSVRYNAKPTTVSATTSTVDIPEKDQWFAVWRIVQHAAPILEKVDQFQIATNKSQEILSNALINRNIGKRPKVRPMRPLREKVRLNPDYR